MSELDEIIRAVRLNATYEQRVAVADRLPIAADAAMVLMFASRHESEIKSEAWLSLREELSATLGATSLAEAAALLETIQYGRCPLT